MIEPVTLLLTSLYLVVTKVNIIIRRDSQGANIYSQRLSDQAEYISMHYMFNPTQ